MARLVIILGWFFGQRRRYASYLQRRWRMRNLDDARASTFIFWTKIFSVFRAYMSNFVESLCDRNKFCTFL